MNGTQQTTADKWTLYLAWNDALAQIIYGADSAGIAAYLDLENPVLRAAAELAGERDRDPRASLISAVQLTLNPANHSAGLFGGYKAKILRWRARASGEAPPVIALLAVLSLAAEDMRAEAGLAAHNYYDRLMPLLGISVEADKKKVISAYYSCSHELWECLNQWLVDLQGDHGLPTAYAWSHAHVGRPLSQALVRTADREKLGELFADLGLPARSRLSPVDMEALLNEWMRRNPCPASGTMRALWGRAAARERIVEVVCQFLGSWEGSSVEAGNAPGQSRTGRPRALIHLLAFLRTFPRTSLELNIVGPSGSSDVSAVEVTVAGKDGATEVSLDVEPLVGGRWRLADPDAVEIGSLLAGTLTLRLGDSGALERRPRRVVALAKDDLLHGFVEVERLPLGEDSIILCKLSFAAEVEQTLEQTARPGYRQWDSVPGLPEGWALFTAVQILSGPSEALAAKHTALEMNALQPLATTQLVLEGGLKLPGRVRRWSSLAPPEVRVVTEDAESITIVVTQTRAVGDDVLAVERVLPGRVALLPLAELGLSDGDYDIEAFAVVGAERRRLDAQHVRLRSANSLNPIPAPQPPLGHNPSAGGLMAMTSDRDSDRPRVRGAAASPTPDEPTTNHSSSTPLATPTWWDRRRADSSAKGRERHHQVVLPSGADDCFQTGAHVMALPTFHGRAGSGTFEGHCRQCGLVKRYPARYRPAGQQTQQKAQSAKAPPILDTTLIAPVREDGIAPDTALDSLIHDRAGRASAIEQLALQVEPSHLFVDRFVRNLDSLGHIETARDHRSFSVLEWETTPVAMVELADSSFVLVGSRSARLIERLEAACHEVGATLERKRQPAAPDRLRVQTPHETIAQIARLTSTDLNIEFPVIRAASQTLVSALPRLSEVLISLPRQAMPGFRLVNKWDPDLARWTRVDHVSSLGAFQVFGATTAYCLRDEADLERGTMRRVDARLAKHGSNLHAGTSLLGYDVETRSLYVPLGADLPGLYGRVAVLATGLLPVEDEAQRILRYRDVPAELAQRVAGLISS